MKKMQNVVDLKPALDDKWLKAQQSKLDRENLFSIDYDDIRRQPSAAANGDNNDEIYYGHTASLQILKLTEAFGFDRSPENWGEFRGMLDYCMMLQGMLLGGNPGKLDTAIIESGLSVIKKNFPLDYKATKAWFENDVPLMRKIHTKENTLARLGKEFIEFPNSSD